MNRAQTIDPNRVVGGWHWVTAKLLAEWRAHAVVRVHKARSDADEAAAAEARREQSSRASKGISANAERNERRSASMRKAWERRRAAHQHGLANGGL